jgi:hypothetical protein
MMIGVKDRFEGGVFGLDAWVKLLYTVTSEVLREDCPRILNKSSAEYYYIVYVQSFRQRTE